MEKERIKRKEGYEKTKVKSVRDSTVEFRFRFMFIRTVNSNFVVANCITSSSQGHHLLLPLLLLPVTGHKLPRQFTYKSVVSRRRFNEDKEGDETEKRKIKLASEKRC